jgi:hypothetical protein
VEALGEKVAERVIFLVEREDCGVGNACGRTVVSIYW